MKVKFSMIDKEYRLKALLFKLIVCDMTEDKIIKTNKTLSKAVGTSIEGVDCSEVFIESRGKHHIRLRIYKPFNYQGNGPGILYIHGGGYYLCYPENEHMAIEKLVHERQCVIVSPDYRRSIDAPYPAALHDCYDTLAWMIDHAKDLGFRPDQVFTIGGSAGGGLVVALNLLARDLGQYNIAYQVPLFAMLDDQMLTDSMRQNNAPIWNQKSNQFGWALYLRDLDPANIPIYAAPARCKDYDNLPPMTTYVGSLDPFLDETINYAKCLQEAGIDVEYKIFEGVFHAFEGIHPKSKKAQAAYDFLLREFSFACDHYFAPQNNLS